MKKRILTLVVLGLVSCGPNFVNPVIAPEAPLEAVDVKPRAKSEGQFYLKSFEDSRSLKDLTSYDGKSYYTDSDLTLVGREGLSRILGKAGFSSSKESAIFIKGKLIEWTADVIDGYPSLISSKAKIYIELIDPTDRRIYSGSYSGAAELQAPGLSNDELRKSLSLAMEKALEQVAKDKGVVNVLTSY